MTGTPTPLVVLDVDGVIFPQMQHDPALVGRALRVAGFPVFLPSHLEVGLAPALAGATLLWLTSWEADAPAFVAPLLSLPAAEHLALRTCSPAEKLGALAETRPAGPMVWVDDQLSAAARRFAAERTDPTLLIRPDPRRGITPRQLGRIRTFIARARRIPD